MSTDTLFDTSILIDYANGQDHARDVFMQSNRRIISMLSRVEFLTTLEDDYGARADAFLQANFEVYPMTLDVCMLAKKLIEKHDLLMPDAIIAATAIKTEAKLVTSDPNRYKNSISDIEKPY